jgi:hypothetical protein
LIATELLVENASVEYPPGEETSFAFADETLSVYSGEVVLRVALGGSAKGKLKGTLRYQACDENACLPVVTRGL